MPLLIWVVPPAMVMRRESVGCSAHRPIAWSAPSTSNASQPGPARSRPRRFSPGSPCRARRRRAAPPRSSVCRTVRGRRSGPRVRPAAAALCCSPGPADRRRCGPRGRRRGRTTGPASARTVVPRLPVRGSMWWSPTRQPPLSGPSSAPAGTRTSLKNTSAKSVVTVEGRPAAVASMPGRLMSTMRQEMPWCLARIRVGAHVQLAPVGAVS